MKKFLILIPLAVLLMGALQPTFTTTSRFFRFQCDPMFAEDGTPISAVVQAFYKTTVNDGTTTFEGPMQSIQWDAVATASETVTVNGKTLTRGEVLQAVIAIAEQVRTTPPPETP